MPQNCEQGTWVIEGLKFSDMLGNSRNFSRNELIVMGFPTAFRNGHGGDLSISGIKFHDINNNGAKDADESGLRDWRIELVHDGDIVDITETAQDGTYSFDDLAPGSYTLQEVPQVGWIQTCPPDGTYSVMLTDENSSVNDFGNHKIQNEDTDPPNVLNFDFYPKVIDTSESSHDITFNADLTDDLSGISLAEVSFCSPSGGQGARVSFEELPFQLGNKPSSMYISRMAFPRYSEKGAWKVEHFNLSDKVGNTKQLSRADMVASGFPTVFVVVSDGDTEPPELTNFDLAPKEINTSTSSQDISVTVNLKDDLSGLYEVSPWGIFTSPSGRQSVCLCHYLMLASQNDASVDNLEEVYYGVLTIPQYCEKGTWKLQYLFFFDLAGNSKEMTGAEVAAQGFPMEFEVVSSGDTLPPNIVEFDFEPKKVDTSMSSREISTTAHFTDDLSGMLFGRARFQSPTGAQNAYSCISFPENLISGSEMNGTYESRMVLPLYSEFGTWKLDQFTLYDHAGNIRELSGADLIDLGFPTKFLNGQSYSGLSIEKTASSSSISPGDLLNYTIIYTNIGGVNLTEVVITERYPEGAQFISASPAPDPGTSNRWTVGDLPKRTESRKIIVTVRVPELQDLEFAEVGRITGDGFVNVRDSLSTSRESYNLKNVVTITSAETEPVSATASVMVADPGTELETREHGSGTYESEEQIKMRTENKSISMEKDVSATHATTTLELYNNRTAVYSSKWTEEARAKNRITGASMSESYRYATSIDRESRMFLDKNESAMQIESEFEGMGHMGFLKMPSNTSSIRDLPIFEAREDYTGSFRVIENVDEYGSSVSSEKSVSGAGLVAVDKRVGESQRSYESGTGTYDSDEQIETNTNYIAKDISLVHLPMTQSLTDDVSIDESLKWNEGMYSKTPKTSFIGEEYTSADRLEKETVARGLNEMETEANFSGRARYRAVLKDEIDFDEQYDGDYSIERKILFTGVPKYDRPHLNVTKTLDRITEETIFDAKEMTLAGESRDRVIKVAAYTIRIENDGNKALGPIYAKDLFPPKSKYINASVRPSELTETYANWTLTHIAIGDASTITLNLDVTKHVPAELVNRVEVCGGYNRDEWVCASNFSAIEMEWLTCCPNETISVRKTAQGASCAKNCVLYRIEIENQANITRVATVIDSLPKGMILLDARVPFASYENDTVVWNLAEIGPFETVEIDYMAESLWSGKFVNSVEVDARSVDGPVTQPVRAKCVVEVGEFEGERSAAGWQPPDWGFVSVCDESCICDEG